jgi:flagellar hook-associated protein 2
VPGVTLNLLTTSPTTTTGGVTTGTPLTLTVADDTTTTTSQVNAFVTAYNALQSEMASLGSYDAATSTAGPLLGDPLLLNLKNEITSNLFATVPGLTGGLNSLASIGITPNSSGQLQVDDTKLQNALSTNYQAVGKIFGATGGVGATLATTLSSILGPTGALQSRTNTLNTEMSQSQTAQTQLDQQMAVLQSTYLTQFTALDTLLANTQSTASFLTTELAGFSTATTEDTLA